ncbi:helix-turn-helix domain-containing protein [Haloarchaeobius sp. HRN-SO-5]|uniref:helix-turn-helix domain-containing protein n=1 Tax=Haloarchaeobius sp. HRN-SO-5 TaxID=3446118 RepID=UPI003EBF440F
MGVLAEFSIEADDFALGSLIGGECDVELRMEPVVPTSGDVMPYVWVSGDVEGFEDAMARQDFVESVAPIERDGDRRLYQLRWDPMADELLTIFVETGGALLDARATDRWYFTVRFPDDRGVTRFHERSQEASYHLELHRLGRSSDRSSKSTDAHGLTPAQREALVRAVESGYFAIPRQATLDDVAEAFDISNQAASERIRRATETVLRQALVDELEPVTKGR